VPEGPEVRQISQQLSKLVSGREVQDITVLSGRYLKKDLPGLTRMRHKMPVKVVGVGVHGKFSYWICDGEMFLWCTLGMTGSWSTERGKHSRVRFSFSDGTSVFYDDIRNFGTLKFEEGKTSLLGKLSSMGPDMLAEDITDEKFSSRLQKRPNWTVAKSIMNQTVIAGVGNYVKADALWLAGISPHRTVESLTDEDLSRLNGSIKQVLRESFQSGGATIRSYKHIDGSVGEYAQRFLVYNQKVDLNGNAVIRETTEDGRTTHWAPDAQK